MCKVVSRLEGCDDMRTSCCLLLSPVLTQQVDCCSVFEVRCVQRAGWHDAWARQSKCGGELAQMNAPPPPSPCV